MRTLLTAWIAALCLASIGGCATYAHPASPQRHLTGPERNFEAVWQASISVLRKYNFTVDRTDRRAGIITTQPLVSQQWFEFWRKDAVTAYDWVEGSLQGVLRTVTVRIIPVEDPASKVTTYQAKVEVAVTRPSSEELSITTTSEAYDMFIMPGEEQRTHRKLLGARPAAGEGPEREARPGASVGGQAGLADRIARDIVKAAAQRLPSLP